MELNAAFPQGLSDRILKLPHRGAPQTVAVIRDAALQAQQYYEVRLQSEDIAGSCSQRDYLSEALAFGHHVEACTRYFRDPRTIELVRAPWIVVRQLKAGLKPQLDCDDITAYIIALALASGASCRITTVAFVIARYNGQLQYSHVFAEILVNGVWIVIDPVAGPNTAAMLRKVVAAKHWTVA